MKSVLRTTWFGNFADNFGNFAKKSGNILIGNHAVIFTGITVVADGMNYRIILPLSGKSVSVMETNWNSRESLYL